MQRRDFIRTAASMFAACGLPSGALLAANAKASPADGEAQPFDFDRLRALAAELAESPYRPDEPPLPDALTQLTPQRYQRIEYRRDQALWYGRDGELEAQFFHVGMGFRQRVRVHELDPASGLAREIHFHPWLFDYAGAELDPSTLTGDYGFAGVRIRRRPHLDYQDQVSFLGASYFRAIDDNLQFGLSARGLAIDAGDGYGEEFPNFTRFWLETPPPDSTRLTLYALLESTSLTGAYRFVIDCRAEGVKMDITPELYLRHDIDRLGVAPMTSMFAVGKTQPMAVDTFHAQLHDSDRLSIQRSDGEWICRPLRNPRRLARQRFEDDETPRGFGLIQADHDFANYQDTEDRYDLRPSLWVEPLGDWGKGAIELLELPTRGETSDNIGAYWIPAAPARAGDRLRLPYRLHWSALPPVKTELAQVHASFAGAAQASEVRRFAVDFSGALDELGRGERITPRLEASHGHLESIRLIESPSRDACRVQFDWRADDDPDPVTLWLSLRAGDRAASETWCYRFEMA
ncbi:glucan biosynthesis protein [Halotalea alkalilenta]|uniref:glucan biosynthesis protein n=1 Tax=Halotalea alkalilenta TaxID=376489 RepID=UPI000488B7AE|nr:glucan biosynthesis protein D [Halotalea alkalilenta]